MTPRYIDNKQWIRHIRGRRGSELDRILSVVTRFVYISFMYFGNEKAFINRENQAAAEFINLYE